MTTADKTFNLLKYRAPEFEARFAKLTKRAAKLHVPAPTFTYGEEFAVAVKNRDNTPTGAVTVYLPVTLTGTTPKFNGWTFAASLEYLETDGGELLPVFKSRPGVELPERYRTESGHCDHCCINRYRRYFFLVTNEAGEFKMVGSTCLADFLGGESPESVARMFEFAAELFSLADDDYWGGGGGGNAAWDLTTVLPMTASVIRLNGWMSATKARELGYGTATKDDVLLALDPPDNSDMKAFAKKMWENMTEDDKAEAELALEWARELPADGDSDYLWNLRTVARVGWADYRTMGLAVSLLPSYRRAMGVELERKLRAAESNWVGEVKKRMELTGLTVTKLHSFEGAYGVTTLVTFLDGNGNVMKWFASGNPELNVGDVVTKAKGTVKAHGEYRGVKETTLTRVAVESLLAPDAEVKEG